MRRREHFPWAIVAALGYCLRGCQITKPLDEETNKTGVVNSTFEELIEWLNTQ